jgi:hypothetical protein
LHYTFLVYGSSKKRLESRHNSGLLFEDQLTLEVHCAALLPACPVDAACGF